MEQHYIQLRTIVSGVKGISVIDEAALNIINDKRREEKKKK